MALHTIADSVEFGSVQTSPIVESKNDAIQSPPSAVSWGAILAGAAGAAALSLILLLLGTGLGLSTVSPWAYQGVSAETFGVSTILWLTFTQFAASGIGGYLAGRLRTKWISVQSDEVYFRDTAHGFLAWAVASLATAVLLSSVISSIVSGGVQAGAAITGGVAMATIGSAAAIGAEENTGTGTATEAMRYFVDSLFRKKTNTALEDSPIAPTSATSNSAESASEVSRIFMNTLSTGSLSPEDRTYVAQVVAQHTGLPQNEAEARVDATYNRLQTAVQEAKKSAKEAADKSRKASAYAALWLFISLLIGAFVASYAATLGGQLRDN